MLYRTTLIALGLLGLSGCSLFGDTFRDRSNDYQLAEETVDINVPENSVDGAIAELYPIPAIPDDSIVPGKFRVPRPQRASLAAFEKQVKIQSLSGKSWVLVQASPDRVWPEIRNVLTRNGILVESLNAKAGLIETVWVNYKEDEDYSHRYRLKVEPGVQFNSTEVSVLHSNAPKGDERITDWPQTSSDKAKEKELRQLVAEALAGDIGNSSVSLLAQTIGGEAKVEVHNARGEQPYVLIKLDYPRSWGSVAYSLNDRDGSGAFSIVDQDRSAGIFYVRYKELDEKGGWFSSWFSSDDDKEIRRVDYHVTTTQVERGVEVRIANPDGSLLEPTEALRLLKEIRGNLS
ncbi:MAG: outer membrane protein assembly factor BamC [Porticoccaceae bacterium]|nr:outer membrane protein assembly factor BamC [Porticoccaceae bacterium]